MRLVIVEWIDSMGSNTWAPIKDENSYKNPRLYSAGWIIHADKEKITLGSSIGPVIGMVGQTMSIPRGCIKKVTALGSKHSIKG